MRRVLSAVAAVLILAGCNSGSNDIEFLEASWDMLDRDERVLFCLVWKFDPDSMVGTTFEHLPEYVDLSRTDVVDFYDSKCP